MPPGSSVDEYFDALRYRRYALSTLAERQRLLSAAACCGTDAWLVSAPVEEVVAAVLARSRIRSKGSIQKLRMVVENYRRWRREREAAA